MDRELDLRGLKCPLPVLKTRHAIRKLEAGSRLWVLTDDPLAVIDVPAFCNESGHKLLDQQSGEGDDYRFHLEVV